MGLPTNQVKGQGCTPVSSNCVIWQGPDIPCISLCKGDSVTDVVAKLATELCTILETLDIKTYDITCFQPICPTPENFHDLIQFLITKVCELQCCCDGTKPSESDCPDECIVTVAPCFYYTNQLGDQISTMTLSEYVTAIGNKVCDLASQIANLGPRVAALEAQQTANGQRFNDIEDELSSAVVTIPTSCLQTDPPPPDGWPIGPFVQTLEQAFCALQNATGTPSSILSAIRQQCVSLDTTKTLTNRSTTYGSLTGWVTQTNYVNQADSVNNMWLLMCDMRAAIENILKTCCCTDCDDVQISFTAVMAAPDIRLFFTGSVPTGLTDCYPNGNWVTFTDSNGGTYGTYVEVVSNLNTGIPVVINLTGTPVNPALDITVTIQGCWKRATPGSDCGGLECTRTLTYLVVNQAPCPVDVQLEVNTYSVDYSFTNVAPHPVGILVKLYKAGDGMLVGTQGINIVGGDSDIVNGTFTGLSGGTMYYIQISVTINGNEKICPPTFFTTDVEQCLAPTAVSGTRILL